MYSSKTEKRITERAIKRRPRNGDPSRPPRKTVLRRDFAGFRFSGRVFVCATPVFPVSHSPPKQKDRVGGGRRQTLTSVRALVCVQTCTTFSRCRSDRRNAITYTIYVHASAKESRRGRFAWRRRIVCLPPPSPGPCPRTFPPTGHDRHRRHRILNPPRRPPTPTSGGVSRVF